MKDHIYYVGFNANNSILNDVCFDGSITLYPTGEKGNIYYSDTLLNDTSSDVFLKKYKMYIEQNVNHIIQQSGNCKIMCFNEKIVTLCKDLKNVKFIQNNSKTLLDFMNDKYRIRNFFKPQIPILDYAIKPFKELNYLDLKHDFETDKLVIQGIKGAGGENTYFVSSHDDLLKISDKDGNYCVSSYVKHLPLNVTLIVGKDKILYFPISAQLISTKDKTFKYVGGDFIYPKKILDAKLRKKIFLYSNTIATQVRKMGYRGILGIDYILTENKDIKFMELNPRFQSSTFILNQYLREHYSIDMATLHYMAVENQNLPQIDTQQMEINKSFLNCNSLNTFEMFENYDIINNGYFKDNKSSVYRKVFRYSLVLSDYFQHIQFNQVKENIDGRDAKRLRKQSFK